MRLSTEFKEIKLMRHITKVNTDSFFSAINLSINRIQEGLPNIMGQKSSCGEPRTRKSVGYFYLSTQDFNISNNPKR